MDNPFARLRRELGLSQPALSLALGVSITAIWQAESGLVVHPRSLLRALAKSGFDPEPLQREYDLWRAENVGPERRTLLRA